MLDIDIKKEIQGRFPLSENRNRRTITSVLFHKRVVTLSKEAFAPIAKTSRRKIHTFPILLKTGVRFFQELFDNWQISNYWDLISCPRTRLQENMICFSPVVETTKNCLALEKTSDQCVMILWLHDLVLRPQAKLFAIIINILLIHIVIVIDTIDIHW